MRVFYSALDSDIDLDEIEAEAKNTISTADYSKLRGFLVIENMLKHTSDLLHGVGLVNMPFVDLTLHERSWGELTRVKTELARLHDETEMEIAEGKLEGVILLNEGTNKEVIKVGNGVSQHLHLISRLAKRSLYTTKAIRLFRPYLRNEDATISGLGELLACLYQEVYSQSGVAHHMYSLTRVLMEARI